MDDRTGAGARSRRRDLLGGLAVALAVCAAFAAARPPRPLEPTGDLYGHLMVARHLERGDGFVTDLAYPLSFAWPFARRLPQPLLHRGPGFALLLAGPVAAVGGDPHRSLAAARLLELAVLGGLIWLGSAGWLARRRPGAAAGWAVLLAAHPLVAFAVDWGHDELPAALLLLACWLRHRERARPPAVVDGLLLGALAALRPELVFLPVLWWLLRRPFRPRRRELLACGLAFALLEAPWAVRNARLTGNPFFSIQAYAEAAKDTNRFPGYAVYRQLEPQPLAATALHHPDPEARKLYRGLRFFWKEQGAVLPVPVLPILLACGVLLAGRRLLARRARRRGAPDDRESDDGMIGPLGLLGFSFLLVAGLYALFDHSVRHFEVLLPIAAWELGPLLADHPWEIVAARFGRAGRLPPPAWLPAALGAAVGLLAAALLFRPPTGWDQAEAAAAAAGPLVERETRLLRETPTGVVFVTTAAAPWFADRPAVWDPLDPAVRARITDWLEAAR